MLELAGIDKSYREGEARRVVFRGLEARFAPGEVCAVSGRSGSGKSTLLNLISGIDLPDAGAVRYQGTDLSALDDRARTLHRRRSIGFVFQFFNLIPTLTVLENLLLPLDLLGVGRRAARGRAEALLAAVGLGDRAGSFPDRLSGGEQQRVALARALIHRPSLVLADEPTGNLDETTGGEVLDLLLEMVAESGATLIMATHSRAAAARAGRLLVIEGGGLREAGERR